MTGPVTDEDGEFTELVDATIPRVDLVGKAANGMRFLIAKADGARGLMDPADVSDLIAKANAGTPPAQADDTVTMSGSPAAIARFIHQAAQRAVTKADMSTASIDDLPDSDFAYIEPGGHKDDEGKTTPRSLRHFPIHDEAHVRNALSRAPESPYGDKAMPKIRAAAKKFGIEVSKMEPDDDTAAALDPTTALAEPDGDAPGVPTDPGSPAWEAIDAATARKWTGLLARARHAVQLLAERERLEAAAADGDGDDIFNAMDLEDAACAIDYAIGVLAPFAVDEQCEADCLAEAMQAVGKAMAGCAPEALDTIEALMPVAKAGRVLSAANEAAIRGAVEQLQKVLASLPAAPVTTEDGDQAVAKEQEAAVPAETITDPAADTTPTVGEVAKADETPDTGEVVKADDEPPAEETSDDGDGKVLIPVYDRQGCLVGVVTPDSITPVAAPVGVDGGEIQAKPEIEAANEPDPVAEAAAAETPDLTPAPPAEVGTPADAVHDDDEPVAKETSPDEVLKSIADVVKTAIDEHSAPLLKTLADQATVIEGLANQVEALKGQVVALEEQPAAPKVFTKGAVPPAHMLRGQDQGSAATEVDVTKAAELRKNLYSPDAATQNQAAEDMKVLAIQRLQEIHGRR